MDMSAFFARRKRLIISLVGLTVCIANFEAWARWVSVIPFNEPIVLPRADRINKEIEIRRNCIHSLELVLRPGSLSRDEAARLVGGWWISRARDVADDTGVIIPIEWSLINLEGNIVASGERNTAGSVALNATEFRRSVEPYLRLTRGRYHLNAAVLRNILEMDGMTSHLLMKCANEKATSGWQDDLLFFGHITELFIALPLLALLFIILIISEIKYLLSYNNRHQI